LKHCKSRVSILDSEQKCSVFHAECAQDQQDTDEIRANVPAAKISQPPRTVASLLLQFAKRAANLPEL
jgi:hypothetical protein